MKKALIICGLSVLILISALTACGSQTAKQPSEPDTPEPAPQSDQIEPAKADLPAEATPELIADIEPIAEAEPTAEPEPTPEPEPVAAPENTLMFTDCNETVYATATVNIRKGPSVYDEKIGSLSTGDSVTRTGIGTGDYSKWSRVILSNSTEAYVNNGYISTIKPSVPQHSTPKAPKNKENPDIDPNNDINGNNTTYTDIEPTEDTSGSLEDLAAALRALDDQGYVGSKTGPMSEEGLKHEMDGIEFVP